MLLLFILLLRLAPPGGWPALRFFSRQGHTRLPARRTTFRPTPVRRRAKPVWAKNEIIRLKAHLPDAGCRQLADTFNRLHAGQRVSVGKTWVSQVLKKHHYDILQMRRQLKHRTPRPQPRNLTWGLDLTGKGDAAGITHSILGLVDHGTRRARCLSALPRKSSFTLLGHLLIAIGEYGKPRAIRTDNEAVFTSRTFRTGLAFLGIRHQRIDLGCPWQNVRIESFFGTVKSVLDKLTVANAETLQHTLNLIDGWYNAIRPHQNLNGRTPLEAWQGIDPYAQPVKEKIYFEELHGLIRGYYLRR